MLVVIKRVIKSNAVLFVEWIVLVKSRYDLFFFEPRWDHDFKFGPHNFYSNFRRLFIISLWQILSSNNAWENTFACNLSDFVFFLDNLTNLRLIVALIINNRFVHKETFLNCFLHPWLALTVGIRAIRVKHVIFILVLFFLCQLFLFFSKFLIKVVPLLLDFFITFRLLNRVLSTEIQIEGLSYFIVIILYNGGLLQFDCFHLIWCKFRSGLLLVCLGLVSFFNNLLFALN